MRIRIPIGSGENVQASGMIRRYYSKGADFRRVTDEQDEWVVPQIDQRPRKRDYQSPNDVFVETLRGVRATRFRLLMAAGDKLSGLRPGKTLFSTSRKFRLRALAPVMIRPPNNNKRRMRNLDLSLGVACSGEARE